MMKTEFAPRATPRRGASASNVAHDLLQGGIYSTQKRDTLPIPLATPSRIRAAPRGALSKAIRRFAETGTRGARTFLIYAFHV